MQINFGGLVISVAFLLVYIVTPLGSILLGVYKLWSKKKNLESMGDLISNIKISEIKSPNKVLMVFILIVFPIFAFLLIDKIIATIYLVCVFQIVVGIRADKKYKKANAIYNQGFIIGSELYTWKKIHSYKLSDNKISFLQSNGMRVDVEDVSDLDAVYKVLEFNEIKLEE